jgi:hypothetical protein
MLFCSDLLVLVPLRLDDHPDFSVIVGYHDAGPGNHGAASIAGGTGEIAMGVLPKGDRWTKKD